MERNQETRTMAELLLQLGLTRRSCGLVYLARAVELVLEEPTIVPRHQVNNRLYPLIARECGTGRWGVEQGIRRELAKLWTQGNRDTLDRIAGYPVTRRPGNRKVIAWMAAYLLAQQEAENTGKSGSAAPHSDPDSDSAAEYD